MKGRWPPTRAERNALLPLILARLTAREREALVQLPNDFAWAEERDRRQSFAFWGLANRSLIEGVNAKLAERDPQQQSPMKPDRWRLTRLGQLVQEIAREGVTG